ncbi:hypothetical protein [Ekhidna sp.]|uniref:hypothetical protein n=1 Tax=Ekhidna sp. TaxID=2608089 RepID=UPI003516E531
MELIIQYEFDPAEKETINKSLINKGIEEWSWVRQTNTGIIENEGMFWMHPFRQNQYNFTEVAPFPGVRLPLEIGKTWTGNLNIGDGWGDWKNSTLSNIYQVVAFEEIDLSYGKMQAWHINSTTTAPFGVSTHNFWFNDELGFVKMIINSYAGQTLQFELIEVIEN